MLAQDIEYCRQKIADEELAARAAPSSEAGCVHDQMAMLYKAELALLLKTMEEHEDLAA